MQCLVFWLLLLPSLSDKAGWVFTVNCSGIILLCLFAVWVCTIYEIQLDARDRQTGQPNFEISLRFSCETYNTANKKTAGNSQDLNWRVAELTRRTNVLYCLLFPTFLKMMCTVDMTEQLISVDSSYLLSGGFTLPQEPKNPESPQKNTQNTRKKLKKSTNSPPPRYVVPHNTESEFTLAVLIST